MTPTNKHLAWFQQQQRPSWAKDLQPAAAVSIDDIVNINGRTQATVKSDRAGYRESLDCHNAIALLKMVRKNMASGAYARSYTAWDPENLQEYMSRYTYSDGRYRHFRRWSRNLTRKNWRKNAVLSI